MPLVMDSTITLALIMEDEDLPGEDKLIEKIARERAMVPVIWTLEIANSLITAVRRGRMPADQCRTRFESTRVMPVDVDAATSVMSEDRTIDLALSHGLTAYDAAYLELAVRHQVPLAILDRQLARAARSVGVEFLGIVPD